MDQVTNFREGQFVKVYQKITDAKKDRLVPFQGKITKVKGSSENRMITVQNALEGVIVERIFPVMSPTITKIELLIVKESKKAKKKSLAAKKIMAR